MARMSIFLIKAFASFFLFSSLALQYEYYRQSPEALSDHMRSSAEIQIISDDNDVNDLISATDDFKESVDASGYSKDSSGNSEIPFYNLENPNASPGTSPTIEVTDPNNSTRAGTTYESQDNSSSKSSIFKLPKWSPNFIWEEHVNISKAQPPIHPFKHFFIHIPKAGGQYTLVALNSLWYGGEAFKELKEAVKEEGRALRACYVGQFPISYFHHPPPNRKPYMHAYKKERCAIWMSESLYDNSALTVWPPGADVPSTTIEIEPHEKTHAYTFIRNPKTHIISQYFHCKESTDHRLHRDKMAESLDEWLQYWVDKQRNGYLYTLESNFFKDPKYMCYRPINLQSTMLKFDPTHMTEIEAKQDLVDRFDVIGLQDRMDKSVCLTLTKYTGRLPEKCDCSPSNIQRRLGSGFTHQVEHHGDTFNTTEEQDKLIDELTSKDKLLYEYAKDIFDRQVEQVEETFDTILCDTYDKN